MTRHVSMDALLYVDDRGYPLEVKMYTDEHSEVCRIEFGNSFTLSVVTPVDMCNFARHLVEFGNRAHDLHYDMQETRIASDLTSMAGQMKRLQQKLDELGAERAAAEEEINAARARYLREEADAGINSAWEHQWEEEVEEAPTVEPKTLPEVMAVLRSEMQELLEHGRDWDQLEEAEPTTLPEAIAVLAEGAGLQRLPQPDPEPRSEPSKVERLMRGTVSAPQIDPMNDPMNW